MCVVFADCGDATPALGLLHRGRPHAKDQEPCHAVCLYADQLRVQRRPTLRAPTGTTVSICRIYKPAVRRTQPSTKRPKFLVNPCPIATMIHDKQQQHNQVGIIIYTLIKLPAAHRTQSINIGPFPTMLHDIQQSTLPIAGVTRPLQRGVDAALGHTVQGYIRRRQLPSNTG